MWQLFWIRGGEISRTHGVSVPAGTSSRAKMAGAKSLKILFSCTLFSSVLFRSVLFRSVLFRSVLFRSVAWSGLC